MLRIMISLIGLVWLPAAFAQDFSLASTAFKDGAAIPVLYSCDGKNISPPLQWSNPPAHTVSYVLTLTSPEWAQGLVYKWVVYNLPASVQALPEAASNDLPSDAQVGMNSFTDAIYRGPCPPDSHKRDYIFELYALDALLPLQEKPDADEVFANMKHHILKQTRLHGTFQH